MILVFTDACCLRRFFLIAYALRSVLLLPFVPNFKEIEPLPLAVLLKNGMFYGLPVVIGVLAYEKLYTKRLSFWEEARYLLKSVLISFHPDHGPGVRLPVPGISAVFEGRHHPGRAGLDPRFSSVPARR